MRKRGSESVLYSFSNRVRHLSPRHDVLFTDYNIFDYGPDL